MKGQCNRFKNENQNRSVNRDTILAQSISPRTNSAPDSERDRKHHVFAPTAGARSLISTKLCMVVGLDDVEPILNGGSHFFDPTHSFFLFVAIELKQ